MRAQLRNTVQDRRGNAQSLVTVHVYEPGTTDEIAATMYENPTGADELTNPLTTDGNGEFAFFLDTPQQVDLVVVENTVERTIPSVAVGSAEPVVGGGGDVSIDPVTLEVIDGVLDITGLPDIAYIRIDGEGSVDDELDRITGIRDGQIIFIEQSPSLATITFTFAGNMYAAAGTAASLGSLTPDYYIAVLLGSVVQGTVNDPVYAVLFMPGIARFPYRMEALPPQISFVQVEQDGDITFGVDRGDHISTQGVLYLSADRVGAGVRFQFRSFTQQEIDDLTDLQEGDSCWNTDTKRLLVYDGAAWNEVGMTPV